MAEDRILNIDEMLATEDVEFITVPVPEWKLPDGTSGSIRFGSIDAGAMIDFTEVAKNATKDGTLRLLVQSIVDAEGNHVKPADVEKYVAGFKKKNIKILNRLLDVVMKLNGISIKPAEIKNDLSEVSTDASPIVLH